MSERAADSEVAERTADPDAGSQGVEVVEERLFRGPTGRVLVATALGTSMLMAGRLVIPPLLPMVIGDLGISSASAGVALSVMWGMTALSQFPGGRLSDLWTRKTVMVGSLGLFLVGLGVLVNATSLLLFVLGAAIVGTGAGLYPPASFAKLSDVFDRRLGQAFGINGGAFDFGGVLAAAIAITITLTAIGSWRVAFLPTIAVLAVVLVIMHVWIDEPYRVEVGALGVVTTGRELFGRPRLIGVLVALSLFNFGWQGVINFFPSLLQFEKGFSPFVASNAYAALFVVGMVTKPLAGRLGDRFGFVTVAAWAPVCTAVGLFVLILTDVTPLIVLSVVLAGIGLATFYPLMMAQVMELLPPSTRGGGLGGVRTIFFAVGAVGPAFVGTVAEGTTFGIAFGGPILALLGAAAVTIWLARTRS